MRTLLALSILVLMGMLSQKALAQDPVVFHSVNPVIAETGMPKF